MLLAECAGMLEASAQSLERSCALRPDAGPVLRDQHRKCILALHAIAKPNRSTM